MAEYMNLGRVLKEYRDGDETSWSQEFAYLRTHHARRIAELTVSIAIEGQRDPVMLGGDGRVWDGHHRLCVLDALSGDGDDMAVLVDHAPPDPDDLESTDCTHPDSTVAGQCVVCGESTDSDACKTCGHPVSDHHKLRCEADDCGGCNGWTCPKHGLTLCGCTYAGGPQPTDSEES